MNLLARSNMSMVMKRNHIGPVGSYLKAIHLISGVRTALHL